MTAQPPPDEPFKEWPAPEGMGWVWADASDSRLATEDERVTRKCRRPGCRRAATWALLRSQGRWWLYCDWHNYGRRIVNGRVLGRVLREIGSGGENRLSSKEATKPDPTKKGAAAAGAQSTARRAES